MLKILVADDHPVVRQGLRRIIEKSNDKSVVGEAETGEEVLQKVKQNEYDLVLLDITMPNRDGMDIIGELKSIRPKLPILVLTIHSETDYAIRMFRLGASGYLTKDRAPQELEEAIDKVIRGEKYIDTAIAKAAFLNYDLNNGIPAHERLTNREYQVMMKIANGSTVKDMARDLTLSVKTVLTHRSRVLEKMGLKSDAQIVNYAFRNKILK